MSLLQHPPTICKPQRQKKSATTYSDLQDSICTALEHEDGRATLSSRRRLDNATEGGGGRSASWKADKSSRRRASTSPTFAEAQLPGSATARAHSSQEHPSARWASRSCAIRLNPHVPTTHMNVRFLLRRAQGGRADLVVRRRLRSDTLLRLREKMPSTGTAPPRRLASHSAKNSPRSSKSSATTTSTSVTAMNLAASAASFFDDYNDTRTSKTPSH